MHGTDKSANTVELSDSCLVDEYCSVGTEPNTAFYQGNDVTGDCAIMKDNLTNVR